MAVGCWGCLWGVFWRRVRVSHRISYKATIGIHNHAQPWYFRHDDIMDIDVVLFTPLGGPADEFLGNFLDFFEPTKLREKILAPTHTKNKRTTD